MPCFSGNVIYECTFRTRLLFYAFCDCTFTKWIVYKLLEFEMKDDGEQFNVPCRVREFIFYNKNATVGSEFCDHCSFRER